MAINTTLVDAAFKEGRTAAAADVPNMKPLYDNTAEVMKTYAGIIPGLMEQRSLKKEQEAASKAKKLKPIAALANGIYDATYNGGEPMPDIYIDAVTKEVERLQAEFEKVNTEGEGDTKENEKARRKITAEFGRVKNEVVKFRTDYILATQSPKDYNPGRIKTRHIDPLGTLLDWPNISSNPNASAEFVNGRLTTTIKNYSTGTRKVRLKDPENTFLTDDDLLDEEEYQYGDPVSYNSSDVVGALNYKNPANDTWIGENQGLFAKQGTTDAKAGKGKYFDNDNNVAQESADFASKLDEEIFSDIVFRRIDGLNAPSLKEALPNNYDIPLSVINNMFLDENGDPVEDLISKFKALDIAGGKDGKDGKLTSDDIPKDSAALKAFNTNIDYLMDSILDVDHQYFNQKESFKIAADYYTKQKISAYNDSYAIQYNEDNPNSPLGTDWLGYDLNASAGNFETSTGRVEVKYLNMKDAADTIKNIEKKGEGNFKGYDGNTYFYKGGAWGLYGFDDDDVQIEVEGADKGTMLSNLRLDNKPKILDYLGKVADITVNAADDF